MTLKKNNSMLAQKVKVNGRDFIEIAKETFTITREKNLYIMTEEKKEC